MYLADYHTHSRISPDASASMTEMAEAAVAAGLDEICFTDHVEPIEWGTVRLRRTPYDWDALTAEFAAAQQAMDGRITLRLGVELGDAPWSFTTAEDLMTHAPQLDFVIGSVHMLSSHFEGQDLYFFAPGTTARAREGMADYLAQVNRLARWGKFDVLGHLTLPLRYLNENRGFSLTFDGFEREIGDIFQLLVSQNRGIELNTNRGGMPLPDEKWLQLYRECGGEIITLGTDAHSPKHVGCAIRERQALLKQCGFHAFCTFENHRPSFHEL